MYAYLKGILVSKEPMTAVIEVAGIAYELRTPLNTTTQLPLNQECKLFTYFHVKEDAHTLFGFADNEQKRLFVLLLSVSGVGPSTALMLLSSLTVNELKEAIVQGNAPVIQKVKGIGVKTAQVIVVELKDKIKKEELQATARPLNIDGLSPAVMQEALQALITLGIAKPTAEKTIAAVVKKHGNTLSVEDIIRYSFKS